MLLFQLLVPGDVVAQVAGVPLGGLRQGAALVAGARSNASLVLYPSLVCLLYTGRMLDV